MCENLAHSMYVDKGSQYDMLSGTHWDSSVCAAVVLHTRKPVSSIIMGSHNACFLSCE